MVKRLPFPFEIPRVYETEGVLKTYFDHPNMAPKISSYLIQRFGISRLKHLQKEHINTMTVSLARFRLQQINSVICSQLLLQSYLIEKHVQLFLILILRKAHS